jgi:peptidoglycan/xylan/chitin deacetylase (PgdA/CDA1 family)
MSNFLVSSGTLFEDFETIGDWTANVGSIAADTALKQTGTQSLKVTAAVGSVGRITKTINQSFSNAGTIVIWVYIENLTDLFVGTCFQIILSSSTSFTVYFSNVKTNVELHEGWNAISIAQTEWTATGAESWDNTMVRLRIALYATTGATPSMRVDSMYINRYSRPKCIITFDDGILSAITSGVNYMAKYRMRGTLYVISNNIGSSGTYATLSQIRTAYNAGWDVCNHTKTHQDLSTLTYAQQAVEIQDCQDYLVTNGFVRNDCYKHVCYPFGGYNTDTLNLMADKQALTATCTIERQQTAFLDSRYLLVRRNLGTPRTLATALGFVDDAIAGGKTLIFQAHRLVASPTLSTEWTISDFEALIDYLQSKRDQIDVMTITEWYKGLTNGRRQVDFVSI